MLVLMSCQPLLWHKMHQLAACSFRCAKAFVIKPWWFGLLEVSIPGQQGVCGLFVPKHFEEVES